MNRTFNTATLIAAAALTLSATAAYGQNKLTADIPFEFRVNGSTLPAGQYEIDRLHLGSYPSILKVTSVETGRGIAVVASSRIYPYAGRAEQRPHIEFRCIQSGCSIRELWDNETGFAFNAPASNAVETERRAMVYLTHGPAAGQ